MFEEIIFIHYNHFRLAFAHRDTTTDPYRRGLYCT